MKRAHFAVLLVMGIAIAGSVWADEKPYPLISGASLFDPTPTAGNNTATAVIIAPAFLAIRPTPEIYYGRLTTDGPFNEDDIFYMRSKGFGFGTERLRPAEDAAESRRYTAAYSMQSGPRAALGLAYTWFTSEGGDIDGATSLDMNMGFIRGKQVFHIVGRNLNRTEIGDARLERYYEAGFRHLLFRGRAALFADARLIGNHRLDDILIGGGAEWRMKDRLTLRGRYTNESEWGASAEVRIRALAIGYHYFSNSFGGGVDVGDGGFTYVRLLSRPSK